MINISKHILYLSRNGVWHADRQNKVFGYGGGWAQPIPIENDNVKFGAMAIVLLSCWPFDSDD